MMAAYDPIAEYYQSAWDGWYLPSVRPALERLFYPNIPSGARLLDACCGCGHVTKDLIARHYQVIGVDISARLIELARRFCSGARFAVADIREFRTSELFDGAISTFDSLNHMLSREDLTAALHSVREALKPDAPFFFDMNLEKAYEVDLGQWIRHSRGEDAGFVRGSYDRARHLATTELIWFAHNPSSGAWLRADAKVIERCYTLTEIEDAVRTAGFRRVDFFTPEQAGVSDELSFGRIYALARA